MGTATHLLTQTVAFAAPGAADQNGDATYGSVQVIACRHMRKAERVFGPAGVTAIESTIIVSEVDIPERSLVWLDEIGAGDPTQARIPQTRTSVKKPFDGYTLYETRL